MTVGADIMVRYPQSKPVVGFSHNSKGEFMNEKNEIQAAMNEKQAAKVLGISVKTIQAWRHQNKGPAYLRLSGKAIRYLPQDLNDFAQGSRVQPRG